MAGVKISGLPAATAANDTDQLEANQGGVSRRVTVDQIADVVAAILPQNQFVHVADFGATDAGNATTAIVAAATAALAAGVPLHFSPITYTISRITFPTGLHLKFNGAILRADGTISGSNDIVHITGGSFDNLHLTTPAVTATSPVQVHTGCTFGSIRLVADSQSANSIAFHSGAVRLLGDNITGGDIYTENFDASGLCGSNITATPALNIRIRTWKCISFKRGMMIRNIIGFSALELWGDVRSPLYTFETRSPMFSTSAAQDVNIGSVWGRGSTEHTWRCGGQTGSVVNSKNITVGRITAINSMRCGVKINVDSVLDTRLTGIDIGPILVENASYDSAPGTNEEALRVEDTDGGSFGPVTALNTDGYPVSCFNGIMVANCTNVNIRPGSLIKNCGGSGIYISDTSELSLGTISHIHVGKTKLINATGDGCWINCPTTTLEDIIVDVDSENTTGFGWKVDCLAATAPVILRGNVHNAAAGSYSGSSDPDIVHDYVSFLPLTGGTLTGALAGTTAAFSGAVTSVTAAPGTNTTQLASTAFVTAAVSQIVQNAQTGNYTLVAADAGKHLYHAVAAAIATYTIPANASVAYPLGTTLSFVNDSANAVTIAITTDTLVLSPGTTTGSRTLAVGGIATALKVTATRWLINGSGLT